MNEEELQKIREERRNSFMKHTGRDNETREPLLDPNRFPEGCIERELKEGYLADEAIRREVRKYPWQ